MLCWRIFAHSATNAPYYGHDFAPLCRKVFSHVGRLCFLFWTFSTLPLDLLLQSSLFDVSVVWSPFQVKVIISNGRLRHYQLAFNRHSYFPISSHFSLSTSSGPRVNPSSEAYFAFYTNPKISLTSPLCQQKYIGELDDIGDAKCRIWQQYITFPTFLNTFKLLQPPPHPHCIKTLTGYLLFLHFLKFWGVSFSLLGQQIWKKIDFRVQIDKNP